MMNKADIFRIVREQAKKITGSGHTAERSAHAKYTPQVIDGHAIEKNELLDIDHADLQQLFRQQFPTVIRQLLGKRYNTINKVSKFILPNGMEQVADELLELLADFASHLASTEAVLTATGTREINQLRADCARSHRAGFALKEVNKAIAVLQGAFSGATGLVGAAVDLPASVIFSLKTIYEIGHSYGFELDDEDGQKAVYFALSEIDLGLIAEKQALFLAVRSLKTIFATGDISQISAFLNSNHSIDQFKNYLTDENGQYKWAALQGLTKLKALRFTLPVIGGVVGAFYNIRLIEEVATQADEIFAKARAYLNQNQDADLTILEAYTQQLAVLEQQAALIASASPLLNAQNDEVQESENLAQNTIDQAVQNIEEHKEILKVEIVKKEQIEKSSENVENKITEGLKDLADQNVVKEVAIESKAENAEVKEELTEEKEASVKKVRTVKGSVKKS